MALWGATLRRTLEVRLAVLCLDVDLLLYGMALCLWPVCEDELSVKLCFAALCQDVDLLLYGMALCLWPVL